MPGKGGYNVVVAASESDASECSLGDAAAQLEEIELVTSSPSRDGRAKFKRVPNKTLLEECAILLTGSKLNLLGLFIPLTLVSKAMGFGESVTFTLALLSLAPLAERLGYVTEEVAMYTNSTMGGLLNASFGNATELIISLSAIFKGRVGSDNPVFYRRLIQVSLLGSILSNLLLVMGSAFLAGGLRHKTQQYKKNGMNTPMMLLVLSTMAIILPTVISETHSFEASGVRGGEVQNAQDASPDNPTSDAIADSILGFSRFVSICALGLYSLFVYFQLSSHRHLYDDDEDEDAEEPEIRFPTLIGFLMGITACISVLSELMVDAVDGAAENWAVSELFLGGIVVPIVGNAAEHASAVLFAYKNKMDIAVSVAVGSAAQISLFVLPCSVLIAWAVNCPLDVNFHLFEAVTLFLSVVTVAIVVQDAWSSWLHGCVLLCGYVTIAGGFWIHRD